MCKFYDNSNEPDSNTIYWDSVNNVRMQYSPIWGKYIEKRISVWDAEKPEYQPQNLPNFQEHLKKMNKSVLPKEEEYSANSLSMRVLNSEEQTSKTTKNHPYYNNPGVMYNNYSQPIDTVSLTKKSPYLGRNIDFSRSKNVPSDMWEHLAKGVNYFSQNKYGEKILNTVSPKGYYIQYSPSAPTPGRVHTEKRRITYSTRMPQLPQQTEELIHTGQVDFYNRNGKNVIKSIPGMNLELEVKVLGDIINQVNYNLGIFNTVDESIDMLGGKIFMSEDLYNGMSDLQNEYDEMIVRVAENGYFTSQDLEIYNKVGKFMSPEKSQNPKAFDESIPPSFLLYILNGN